MAVATGSNESRGGGGNSKGSDQEGSAGWDLHNADCGGVRTKGSEKLNYCGEPCRFYVPIRGV